MGNCLVISETFDFRPSSRKYLDNGFLSVSGRAARTGVYQYLASELGLTDREPNEIVNVYRPAEEVFSDKSLSSYSNADITDDHPVVMVDAETFKKVSVGHVVSASRDGDFVNVDMLIKDETAIKTIESGKSQLSPGYTAIYMPETGCAPCGTKYEFKQTSIDVNHLAIVSRGRGGAQVRINDKSTKLETVMVKITLDSGRSVEIEDSATATLINDTIERLNKRATDAEAETEKAKAESDAKEEKLKEAEDALKVATDAETINKRIKSLTSVKDSAVRIAGKEFACDSVSEVEVKRAALTVTRDSIDWADKSDEYVNAAFDFADECAKDKDTEDMEEEEEKKKSEDSLSKQRKKLAQDGAKQPKKVGDARMKREFIDSNQWRVTAGQWTQAELNERAGKIGG